jgi:hypothetical protein
MRTVALVLAACAYACGSGGKSRSSHPANHRVQYTLGERTCQRLVQLHAQHCAKLDELDSGPECTKSWEIAINDDAAGPYMSYVTDCVNQLDTCADVTACMGAFSPHETLRGCDDKGMETMGHAVGELRTEWRDRVVRHARKYSEIKSSKHQPVELCGIPTENEWVVALACDDGSQPLRDKSGETARVGNVGEGGRCNSVIDLYRVKCPEATYDIFLDGYVCPLP